MDFRLNFWAFFMLLTYIYNTIFAKMHFEAGPLLKTINSPEDLKKFPREKLHQICDELRQYIIDVVSVQGGHFASS
jgi:hypothetical protein